MPVGLLFNPEQSRRLGLLQISRNGWWVRYCEQASQFYFTCL